jgi:hypothetical protein
MYPRISINPKICHGQACIKGTHILVHQIIHMLANGDTIEELHHGILIVRLKQPNRHKIHERVMQAMALFAAEEWCDSLVVMRDVMQSVWRTGGRS